METSDLIIIWFFSLLGLGLLIKLVIEYIILKNIINKLHKIHPVIDETQK